LRFESIILILQMEKQVLEQTLQQVLEQPISKNSSPTSSQQDAVRKEDKKSPEREQVQAWHNTQHCNCCLIPFDLSAGVWSLQHTASRVACALLSEISLPPYLCCMTCINGLVTTDAPHAAASG